MDKIGVVIKSTSIYHYIFKPFRGVDLDVGSFVATEIDGIRVVSRVTAIRHRNATADPRLIAQLDEEATVREVKETLGIEEALFYTEAKAAILGARLGGRIYRPQKPVKPFTYVYKTTTEELKQFFAPPQEGTYITVGHIKGTDIPAYINAERLVTHHCAILASTGAGKSWLAGVIIERLALLDVPIIVVDPHGEYSAMSVPATEEGRAVAERVRIYVAGKVDVSPQDEAFARRYGRQRTYTRVGVNPRSIPLRTLERLLDMLYTLTDAQKRILEEGWQATTSYGEKQPLTTVEELIREILEGGRHAAPPGYAGEMALRGLEGRLRSLFYSSPIFLTKYGDAYQGEPIKLIDPAAYLTTPAVHIFDISGLEGLDQQIFLTVLLDQLYRTATKRRNLATLIVIEEAHNYAPAASTALAKTHIAKIAREGRKFGLGLCLITQRPARLDQDVASQAMTQIFKRMINPHDLKYVATVAEHLDDPRPLRTLDETEAVVTGLSVPAPLLITVDKRWTNHGGTTPALKR
ncbi:helicase HerA domain-containing protein [Pyrobaculum sp.]|uniref:helicase HerA domain-containing protein n=1 Tax=Pyrobaculum sp. TaxID=2004705 RepID=UPI003D129B0E